MHRTTELQDRLANLRPLVSGLLDCFNETENNARRGEWEFAETNLRKLFRNATAIRKQRAALLRELRLARREEAP